MSEIKKKAYSVKTTAYQIDASPNFVRDLIKNGILPAKKASGRVLILDSALETYLENLPDWKPVMDKEVAKAV